MRLSFPLFWSENSEIHHTGMYIFCNKYVKCELRCKGGSRVNGIAEISATLSFLLLSYWCDGLASAGAIVWTREKKKAFFFTSCLNEQRFSPIRFKRPKSFHFNLIWREECELHPYLKWLITPLNKNQCWKNPNFSNGFQFLLVLLFLYSCNSLSCFFMDWEYFPM